MRHEFTHPDWPGIVVLWADSTEASARLADLLNQPNVFSDWPKDGWTRVAVPEVRGGIAAGGIGDHGENGREGLRSVRASREAVERIPMTDRQRARIANALEDGRDAE